MRKIFIKLVPALLVFLLSACATTSSRVKNLPEKDSSSLPFFSQTEQMEKFSPHASLPPSLPLTKPSDGFWNTEDIDVEDIQEGRKLLSFTFDDSPSRTMESILAVFAAFNEENFDCKATATFFFNGKRFDGQTPLLLHTAYAMGFELGNHTHGHMDLSQLTSTQIQTEIDKTDRLLEEVDGKSNHLLRAPFGRVNEGVRQVAEAPLIDWSIDTLDWTGVSAQKIFDEVWNKRFSGAIVLMHDGYDNTVTALKRLLPALKEDGYQVVSVSKMIKAHGCRFEKGKVYIRARKKEG